VGVVVWIALSSLVGLIVGPPVPTLDLFTNKLVNTSGVLIPRPANWALESHSGPGLLYPWTLHAPGSREGRPPTTITAYTPVVTTLVDSLVGDAGDAGIDRAELLKQVIAAWTAEWPANAGDGLPPYTLSDVVANSATGTPQLGQLITFGEATFPYAPRGGVAASPSPATSTDPSASAVPSPSATPRPSNAPVVPGTVPLGAIPVVGAESEAQMVVKMAVFIPTSRDFVSAGLRRMLVLTLAYDAALPATQIAEIENAFTVMLEGVLFP
jgi:hypothetical protein